MTTTAMADEGMWLFTKPPTKQLKDKYGFEPDAKWLEHLQKSSVRFNAGGSGSFVSADGLVMTNHHVGADAIQKIDNKENKEYLKNGFHARKTSDEIKCIGSELNVLISMEDVTERVNAAVKPDMKPEDAAKARRAVMAEIEKESTEKTKLRSDVVTLYQGGQYHLYRYKKYTDVRLVFAPEQQIAFFGGDPDNFEYPRYDLDVCFFRVYEDNKPAKIEHFLKWSKSGAEENELVFVSGHPGRTSRMNTVAELEYLRDTGFPFLMQRLNRLEVLLSVYSERSEENRRIAKDDLFGVANSRKARTGGLAGLLDPELMARKAAFEKKLQDAAKNDEKLKDAADAWKNIAAAQNVRKMLIRRHAMLEQGAGFNSALYHHAVALLRGAEELPKPNGERLREFRDSALDSLEDDLFSEEKIYPEYEIVKLTDSLTFLCAELGAKNPLVVKILAGKSPSERATELVTKSKLGDAAERKKLWDRKGSKAVADSTDPMILLAKIVDPQARAIRKDVETKVDEPRQQAYAQIAKVKYAVEGDSTYPDATFTLRLAFGPVKGFEENGKQVPYQTNFAGLYEHSKAHGGQAPFDLPERWVKKKDALDLKVPFNFICTADIIGGNSGSPVVNKNNEVVGLIFDGNIQSLVLDFAYSDKQARALAVHSAGIIEALTKVYDAKELVEELKGKNGAQSSQR